MSPPATRHEECTKSDPLPGTIVLAFRTAQRPAVIPQRPRFSPPSPRTRLPVRHASFIRYSQCHGLVMATPPCVTASPVSRRCRDGLRWYKVFWQPALTQPEPISQSLTSYLLRWCHWHVKSGGDDRSHSILIGGRRAGGGRARTGTLCAADRKSGPPGHLSVGQCPGRPGM